MPRHNCKSIDSENYNCVTYSDYYPRTSRRVNSLASIAVVVRPTAVEFGVDIG